MKKISNLSGKVFAVVFLLSASSISYGMAATIFSEDFGTGSTVSNISDNGWTDGGNSGTDAEKRQAGSGDDSVS